MKRPHTSPPPSFDPPEKSPDDHFRDWEGEAFGFGYGSGEPHIIPALKAFLEAIPVDGAYDYEALEREFSSLPAWLLLNVLCHQDAIEYGTSPRYGWLTSKGKRLRAYVSEHTADDLVMSVCTRTESDIPCYLDHCNCDRPKGAPGCINPFWRE